MADIKLPSDLLAGKGGFKKGVIVPRTIGTPSVSGASGPAKAKPSVEYTENALGKAKVVKDGKTEVTTDYTGKDDVARGVRQAYFFQHGVFPPCINTSCKSYGRPHPNCLCYGNHSDAGTFYAQGGEVCSSSLGHHEKCEHYAGGGQIEENMRFHNNPVESLDHAAVHHGLLGLLTKVGHSKDTHKHVEDYIHHSKKGHKSVQKHMTGLLEPGHVDHDKSAHEELKNHLQFLSEHPEKMLDVGGAMGDILPDHAIQLAGKAANATNYLAKLKPLRSKSRPLDALGGPDRASEGHYDRHLSIAQSPMIIMNHVKDGTLRPDDMQTLQTIYPGLAKSMKAKAFERIVDAEQKGQEIPYKQKQSLSILLGEPLDSSMTPAAMQAIIQSAGPQQAQNQAKNKKASGVELNQINKINSMDYTSQQALQKNKKD